MRGAAAAVAVVAGGFGVTHSLAQAAVRSNAELAHRLAPYDGRITARLAASLVGPETTDAGWRRADRLALDALRRDPTAVAAAATLGLHAQAQGDTARARRLFAYSERLSRRDLPTQLWAIEDAVAQGNIGEALRHYDVALRVTPASSELLYPVLGSAIADPAIRTALVRTLATRPRWSESFVAYAGTGGPDPRSMARLLLDMRRSGIAVPETAHASIVNALLAKGFDVAAWTYYASVRPGVDRRMSRDQRFAASTAPSQFDWVPTSDGSVTASIQRGEHGGIFDFTVPAGAGGPLLQQVQLLPPGTYRIQGHGIGIEQPADARPYWVLSCRDGRELGRIVLAGQAENGGRFAGTVSVPVGCPLQTLTLVARPSEGGVEASGQIDRLQLSPVALQ